MSFSYCKEMFKASFFDSKQLANVSPLTITNARNYAAMVTFIPLCQADVGNFAYFPFTCSKIMSNSTINPVIFILFEDITITSFTAIVSIIIDTNISHLV